MVCGGGAGLAPLCPPNTTSPPLGSSPLYVHLSSPREMSQNPEGQKQRVRARRQEEKTDEEK